MNDEWQNDFEDESVTLGPEAALQREIEKTKSLKVERLKLRDEIENLKKDNQRLARENSQQLDALSKFEQTADQGKPFSSDPKESSIKHSPAPFSPWAWTLLLTNLFTVGLLIYMLFFR
ncbi:MAG: hypothetical protein ACE5EK_00405 [Nitrospinales bacterium]